MTDNEGHICKPKSISKIKGRWILRSYDCICNYKELYCAETKQTLTHINHADLVHLRDLINELIEK